MITIKELLEPYKSYYAANKALGRNRNDGQLIKWDRMGAKVDDNGQVFIRTCSDNLEHSKLQLKKWAKSGAIIGEDGQIWIKTGKPLNLTLITN